MDKRKGQYYNRQDSWNIAVDASLHGAYFSSTGAAGLLHSNCPDCKTAASHSSRPEVTALVSAENGEGGDEQV